MTNGNGKFNREVLKTLGLVVMALTIVVQSIVKSEGSSKLADEVKSQAVQIARLEECILSLRPLPQEVASIKATLVEIGKRLDSSRVAEK